MPTVLSRFAKYIGALLATVLLGGLLGASLLRFAPGYGVDEAELDLRLSKQSIEAIRSSNQDHENIVAFYVNYLRRMLHGDLGVSRTLQQPVLRLIRDRFPETLKSIALGLLLGWGLGLSLAVAVVI